MRRVLKQKGVLTHINCRHKEVVRNRFDIPEMMWLPLKFLQWASIYDTHLKNVFPSVRIQI